MFCSGYPDSKNLSRGVFTHRTALKLSSDFDLTVVSLSAWKPKRNFRLHYLYEGVQVVKVAVFQMPHFNNSFLIRINICLMNIFLPFILGEKIIKECDFIHSTMLVPTSFSISKLATRFNKFHLGQAIGDDVNIYIPKLPELYLKKKINELNYIQFNSEALRSSFYKFTNFPIEKTQVIYRGVDVDFFKLEKLVDNDNENVVFLFLGGIQTYIKNEFNQENTKGAHVLINAWKTIDLLDLPVKLIFGGPGVEKKMTLELFGYLKNLEKITILEQKIKPIDVPMYLKSCNVLIIPSLFEGLPNLANEAQACGIPIIASRAGGIPETVIDGVTGYLFDTSDSDQLAELIKKVTGNRQLLYKMGERGRNNVVKNFSWENFVDKVKKILYTN
jgi:glycosyltransferase involved in cell wall biosynthesis